MAKCFELKGFCKFPAEREIYLQRWSHPTDFSIWDSEQLLQSAPGGGGVALNVMSDGGVNVIWHLPGADVGLNGVQQRYYPAGAWPGTPVTSAVPEYPGFGYYQTMTGDESHTVILSQILIQASSAMGCIRLR